ncbi:amino acid adenylation domain-containing protein [Aurantibacter sp.]|uniref:amino acid adenylation domain-containing protein n=1 Tax=Aurantibacter sp. TaxID=2807103 RepID=UPI003267B5BC
MPTPNHMNNGLSSFENHLSGIELDYPDSTLHKLFDHCATRNPNANALQYKNETISYAELQNKVNQTAHYLHSQGLNQGDIVSISLDRTPEFIISIFAILQCGAAYLPIDTGYPPKRIELILKDSNSKFFISTASHKNLNHQAKNIFVENLSSESLEFSIEPLKLQIGNENVAYIIYTSGSTGNPKGVQVAHKNVINLVHSMSIQPGITTNDKIFAVTTISFDAMVMETFLPLLNGATVILIDEDTRRDGELLIKKALEDNITIMWGTPTIWQILIDSGWEKSLKLKALIGGEPVPKNLADKLLNLCGEVWNIYGPTETTVCSILTQINEKDDPIVVGKPIANTQIHLLDENKKHVKQGEIGEIVIGGDGVSLGYLNQTKLTDEVFVTNPFDGKSGNKMYLSGDLGKLLPNGKIQCLGRKDKQVKVRGHRIELGEIEAVLSQVASIKKSAVIVSNAIGNEPKLVAYIQSKDSLKDTHTLRLHLEDILPEYLIPSIFMWVDEFPVTTNGKVDFKNLPKPEYVRPESAPLFKKPRSKQEVEIVKIWSEQLQIPTIGIDDNFFEMGGTSLLTQKVASQIRKRLKIRFPVTSIYQFPTIASLSKSLNSDYTHTNSLQVKNQAIDSLIKDVAIIGMAGRFPGVLTIDQFWEVLRDGKETISFFTPEELDKAISEDLRKDPLYIGARGVVPSAKEFDARFFGINPKLAEAMDPQQRLFLEIAWEALEESGHLPKHYNGSIGVYAGTGTNTYYKNNILPNKEILNQIGHLLVNTVNEKDYIASRTAYHLNLKGPAVSVHSACSTSLLAIAEAVEAIRNGQCDIALAGGSSLTAPINSGHLYQEGSMLSSDGHCRSFDADAKGTVFSDGAGVILLKNLSDAKKDGDHIYGVIKGVGINNDGGGKGSFTAPSIEGQADAISRALNDANISASDISYVETHGTATPLGDPIEIEGLNMAFGEQTQNGYCAIGSVKSNLGHCTAGAGVAGVIKTILSINNKQIPASLGYSKPNPNIDFENSPFYVNNTLTDWKIPNDLRRAGISSFGVGGTNVHIVVEEYVMESKTTDSGRPLQILPWSAKTDKSLTDYGEKLGNYLTTNNTQQLADISFSLNMTRDDFNHRKFILAKSNKEAAEFLLQNDKTSKETNKLKEVPNEIAFLFPGQGAQYLQMGKALYQNENIFKKAVDSCAELLLKNLEIDIREVIFPKENSQETTNRLKDTRLTQPALFVIEYALAQLWLSWGIKPTVICGHSIGEFVGAHLAGVINLQDALHLIATRGRLVSELPEGSMLSVRLTKNQLEEILPKSLSIAAINSDRLCVVSGLTADIENFMTVLKEQRIPCQLLATSHAFHSTMMDPVLDTFKDEVDKIQLNKPKLPIVSTVTGNWLTDQEATSSAYWTNHLRATVCFSDALDTILALEDVLLLEVGPGKALTTLTQQKKAAKTKPVISSLAIPKSNEDSYYELLNALGQLWLNGIEPNWSAFYEGQIRKKLRLPSYAFDRKLCWVDPITIEKPKFHTETNSPIVVQNQKTEPLIETIPMRKPILLTKISELIANASGIELENSDNSYSFLELGLDSLILTQIALTCKKEFNIPITFRQLNEDFNTPDLLAEHLDQNLDKEAFAPKPIEVSAPIQVKGIATNPSCTTNVHTGLNNNENTTLGLIAQQIQLLGKQVELMQGGTAIPNPAISTPKTVDTPKNKIATTTAVPSKSILSEEEKIEHQKPFGAAPRIEKKSTELSDSQMDFLEKLTQQYNKKTIGSKNSSQKNRALMADPRVVSGFKPLTKELIYPLVIEKSLGNRLWDLDGNEYIDALNGFGSCIFGHQPNFVTDALKNQIDSGYEVGPQHPLAGEVCELLCEFTEHDRAALCNTGSEAVLGAMRIARTVTGRSLIVAFSKSYHGINDEGIVRGSKKLRTFPAAAGILPEAVQNMLILEYGTAESLQIIKDRAHELAAVLIEPVQSRRPEFQPIDFIKEVREITFKSSTALIFDEVITGFRAHPGGFQGLTGIKADLATYGKVIGGGLSIGAILGKKEYMNALDGGTWQYGDDSYPEVGVTYFAGTFVRHPLALAASKASLLHMKEEGPQLQENLTTLTTNLATELNLEFHHRNLPLEVTHFSSLWRLNFKEDIPYSELLFVLLRGKGIHIWDGFPCFLTTAYTANDINTLIIAILESLEEMMTAGFFQKTKTNNSHKLNSKPLSNVLNNPPVSGARLGLDQSGNPAWFLSNRKRNGEFVKIAL